MRKALRLLRPGSRRELARALAIIRPAAGEAKRQLHAAHAEHAGGGGEEEVAAAVGLAAERPSPSSAREAARERRMLQQEARHASRARGGRAPRPIVFDDDAVEYIRAVSGFTSSGFTKAPSCFPTVYTSRRF